MCETAYAWLKGKTILFVDDRPDSMVLFIEWVKNNGGKILVRRTINGALNLMNSNHINFAVIDIFLDDNDNRLRDREFPVEQTGTNQGQLLGWELQNREPAIPYLYLTANSSWFVEREKENKKMVFRKSSDTLNDFIEYVKSYLG